MTKNGFHRVVAPKKNSRGSRPAPRKCYYAHRQPTPDPSFNHFVFVPTRDRAYDATLSPVYSHALFARPFPIHRFGANASTAASGRRVHSPSERWGALLGICTSASSCAVRSLRIASAAFILCGRRRYICIYIHIFIYIYAHTYVIERKKERAIRLPRERAIKPPTPCRIPLPPTSSHPNP